MDCFLGVPHWLYGMIVAFELLVLVVFLFCVYLKTFRWFTEWPVVVEKWSRVAVALVPTEPLSRQLVFRYALIDCGEDMPAEKISSARTTHSIKVTADYQQNFAVQCAKILAREEASRISAEYVIVED